jgi:hypothetical protein
MGYYNMQLCEDIKMINQKAFLSKKAFVCILKVAISTIDICENGK